MPYNPDIPPTAFRADPDQTLPKFRGHTLFEAADHAVRVGTIGAWEWFQAWFNADLEEDAPPPEEW